MQLSKLIQKIASIEEASSINLFGEGGCEATTGWNITFCTLSTDSDNEQAGTYCLKQTLNATKTSGNSAFNILSILDTSKYYLISAYIKNGNATNTQLRVNCIGDKGYINTTNVTGTSYERLGAVIQPSDFDGASVVNVVITISGTEYQYTYFDSIMVNEISAAEYASGAAACLAAYPYEAP